jgi:hypothetical protein
MNGDNAELNSDEQTYLDELKNMLEKQIDFARQGNVGEIEALSEQANCLVEKISRLGILELPEFESQRGLLRSLYQDLYLALSAQQAANARELSRIRRGKKTIAAYGGNI